MRFGCFRARRKLPSGIGKWVFPTVGFAVKDRVSREIARDAHAKPSTSVCSYGLLIVGRSVVPRGGSHDLPRIGIDAAPRDAAVAVVLVKR